MQCYCSSKIISSAFRIVSQKTIKNNMYYYYSYLQVKIVFIIYLYMYLLLLLLLLLLLTVKTLFSIIHV